MVLQRADFRDGDDVVWRLVWTTWRRLWKEDEITSVDALQSSSWGKSTMGTYCMHYEKLALWVAYTPIDGLETEACRYLFQLWALGYPKVSFGGRYQQCGHWKRWDGSQSPLPATFGDVQNAPPLRRWRAVVPDWRSLGVSPGRVMAGHSGQYTEWRSYCSPACCGWARQPPSGVEGPVASDWGFTPSSVTHTLSEGGWGATAGRGSDGWTVRGLRPRSHWRTSARTSSWSWQPPSAAAKVSTRNGTCGGGVGRRPCAGWGYRSDGSRGGVVGC